ncbi:MAG: hypothetical protein IJV11_04215 [Muribaculaceae bacterium]|nr:hypothetical protein [Muribaculaceae bacterium]
MKKIYILTAVLALLTLSLNAQLAVEVNSNRHKLSNVQLKDLGKLGPNVTFNEAVRGSIRGMKSILPEVQTPMRAPMRYDATQYYTLGPFEGDNFDFGFGFPQAYDANQDVTITTQLLNSEYEDHLGDSIVGFRLALYGDGNKMAKVDQFMVRPMVDNTIYTADGYSWALKNLRYENPEGGDGTVAEPVGDITIVLSSSFVGISSIVVKSGNTTLTSWQSITTNTNLPSTWQLDGSSNFNSDHTMWLGGSRKITIPASLLNGSTSVQVTVTGRMDSDSYQGTVTVNDEAKSLTSQSADYTWSIAASGSGASTTTKDVSFTGSYSSSTVRTMTNEEVTLSTTTGDLGYNNYVRLNGTTTISTTEGNITKIVFTGSNTTYPVTRLSTTTGSYTTSNNVGTWTGRASSVSFTSTQVAYCSTVVVTIEKEVPSSGSVDGNYVNLTTGQWHEFYLNQPVEFQMRNDATSLLMGYDFLQYPSSNTTQVLNPAAFNSQSTGHTHLAQMMQGTSTSAAGNITITIPGGYNVSFYIIAVYDGETGDLLTSWTGDGAIGGTYGNNNTPYYTLPTGWSLTGANYLAQESVNAGDETYYFGYVSTSNQASINIANSALQGKTNVDVYIVAVAWEDGETVSVNGSSKAVENAAFTELEWDNIFNAPTQGWYTFNTSPAGDLAVQLIFKEGKTPAPTITGQVDPNNENNYVITATGDGTVTLTIGDQTVTGTGSASITVPRTDVDQIVTATATAQDGDKPESNPTVEEITVPKLVTPSPTISSTDNGDGTYTITATGNGTVTLNIEGYETATGTGSASIIIPRTEVDQTITATATAQESGKAVSEPTVQAVTVPALPQTDAPTISYVDNGDGTYTITATGDGTVSLTVFGQTVTGDGSASITIVRSIEDQTVTATATAHESGKLVSDPAIEQISVPALTGGPAEALEGLLRMHLLVVDQFKENIPDDNSHPEHYGYVLKWEPNGPNGTDVKESGTVEVDIQKTEAQVNGYYTLSQVMADTDHENSEITLNVLRADVSMDLPGENPDVLYYQMQGTKDANPRLGQDYLTQLQYMKNVQMYEEMLETSPDKSHQYPAKTTYHYYNASTPITTGDYGVNFLTYAPSVSTWGIQRRYFEADGLDNTYGAPIWKTGVGQVRMISTEAQLQRGPNGSTQWDGVGGPCSLVFLGLEAFGDLPSIEVSNILYEPYMFRVWVQSPNNYLRGCTLVPKDENRPEKPGEHWEGDGTSYGAHPVLVYEGPTTDGHLVIDVEEPPMDNQPWGSRIQFGALDAGISDLIVYVRFYYKSTGKGIKNNNRYMLRAEGDENETPPEVPGYYAVEDDGDPQITTSVMGVYTDASKPVESVTYVNAQGMQSSKPFDGVNLVVTRYTDGTTSTTKVVR